MKLSLNNSAKRFSMLALCGALLLQAVTAQDNTAALQAAANTAATNNTTMVIGSGTYNVSAPIEIRSSVTMNSDTIIKATASLSAVFRVGSSGVAKDIIICGGVIDANNYGDGIWMRQYKNARLNGVRVHNALKYGFRIGDTTLWNGADTLLGFNLYTTRTSTSAFQTGSVALFVDTNALNTNINEAILVGSEVGVQVKSSGNYFSNLHAWAYSTQGMMNIAFDDQGHGNFWHGNVADSVMVGLWVHGYNTMITSCRFYNNSLYSSTSSIPIKFDKAQPYASVGNCIFTADAGHTFSTDVTGATPVAEPSKVLRWVGNVTVNVTSPH